jgi:hypothetical protein
LKKSSGKTKTNTDGVSDGDGATTVGITTLCIMTLKHDATERDSTQNALLSVAVRANVLNVVTPNVVVAE